MGQMSAEIGGAGTERLALTSRPPSIVGRRRERDLARALATEHRSVTRFLYFWGPPGIGKSALLRQLASELARCASPVVVVDDADDLDPEGSAERLRDDAGALVLGAGRREPPCQWLHAPPFGAELHAEPLGALTPSDATELLASRGLAADVIGSVLAHAHGHPLFLAVAADPASRAAALTDWASGIPPWLACRFLELVLDEVTSRERRSALEVCAIAGRLDQRVLASALRRPDGFELFEWLRRSSLTETTPLGLSVCEPFRSALLAELRWRDPDGAATVERRVRRHYEARLRPSRVRDPERLVRAYAHVTTGNPVRPATVRRGKSTELRNGPPIADLDADADVLLVEDEHGDVRAGAAANRATGPGDEIVLRCWGTASYPPARAALLTELVIRILSEPTTRSSLLVIHDDHEWASRLASIAGSHPASPACGLGDAVRVEVGSSAPPLALLLSTVDPPDAGSRRSIALGGGGAPLDRARFAAAVRDALRGLHNRAALETSPLLLTSLVPPFVTGLDRVAELQRRITRVAEDVGRSRRGDKPYRALRRTYLEPSGTQEQAADALGLPFGTYRRHLRSGIELVTSGLWAATRSGGAT